MIDKNRSQIGPEILKVFKEHGYSRVELAKMLGITPQAIYKWASGTAVPDIVHILTLSNKTGIALPVIFEKFID